VKAVIFGGIQATGTTSFSRERFLDTHLRINLDMLGTRRRKEILVRAWVAAKQPFVIHDTTLRPKNAPGT